MIRRVFDWIAFRTTKRYNVIKIRTLEPNYWDKDTLLLHGVMQLVVDFVEIECSQMQRRAEPRLRERLIGMLPWCLRFDELYRSREQGVLNLKWQATLDDPNLPEEERNPEQAEAARVILEVYTWWKDVYPNRASPYDVSDAIRETAVGLHATGVIDDETLRELASTEPQTTEELLAEYAKCIDIEHQYAQEDAEMLKRVIDVRNFLWT